MKSGYSPFLLVIDVGNTSTSFGLIKIGASRPQHPKRVMSASTESLFNRSFLEKFLKASIRPYQNVKGIAVSSVVPSLNGPLKRAIKKLKLGPSLFVSASTPMKIKVRYRTPKEVGADRLVNARAASAFVKGSSIVVDFGTATTFDCTNAKREYLGGVIAPGPVISAEALYQRTAKLPRVDLNKAAGILGKNTLESIQAGLYHGYRGLVKEIIARLKVRMGRRTKVLATGGQAKWILKGMPVIDRYIPELTLTGLALIWEDNHE